MEGFTERCPRAGVQPSVSPMRMSGRARLTHPVAYVGCSAPVFGWSGVQSSLPRWPSTLPTSALALLHTAFVLTGAADAERPCMYASPMSPGRTSTASRAQRSSGRRSATEVTEAPHLPGNWEPTARRYERRDCRRQTDTESLLRLRCQSERRRQQQRELERRQRELELGWTN